jgi:uncharacterized protein (TIGR02246 family)
MCSKKCVLGTAIVVAALWVVGSGLRQGDLVGGQAPRPKTQGKTQPGESPTPDEAAIRKATESFVAALESGDAKSVANHWTATGEYMDPDGRTIRGREAIEKAYTEALKKKPDFKIAIDVDWVRFLSRDTAVEEGYFKVQRAKTENPTVSRYVCLYVREDGRWRIALLRESPSDDHAVKEIDWLVGTWVANRDGTEVRTTYEPALDRAFLRAEFTIKKGDETTTGMQMIGMDNETGLLRMWTFDSEGGYADSTWTRDGEKWSVQTTAVLTDGSIMSANNIFTRVDNDAFTWQSVERTLDGEPLDDIPPIKVTRVKGTE